MLLIAAFGTLLIVVATGLPLSRRTHWIFRGMDFPRLQIAVVAGTLLLFQLMVLDWKTGVSWLLFAATFACLLWQLWWVAPYSIFWPKEVKASTTNDRNGQLRVMTSNVLKTNRNSDALIRLVKEHQPDVLITLESDKWWQDQLQVLEADLPNVIQCPLDNLYGMHVYSRLPFSEEEICYLVEDDIPSIHLSLELPLGVRVRMHFVHPAPPSPTENTQSKQRDAELITVARNVAESGEPLVVAGDLNDVAWSSTTRLFRKISGLLDPRIGRGVFNTFHVNYPFLRWPLDHLFHSAHFTVTQLERLPSIGSDHFPLFVVLAYEGESSSDQEGLAANSADRDEAALISDAMDVSKADVPSPGNG